MDSILSLAFSLQRRPGTYALLLGAGISQSVGIKTGWEITQDLKSQIKQINGDDLPENIGYDELLALLGKTQAARNDILRSYFEPTTEERERQIKLPSAAHRAIAKLVANGYIKVIFTTNFDRLMETALEDIHITPDVIRSDDMLKGTPPIRHSAVTIVQLHGDYRDIRTLNTPSELEHYSDVKNEFLDSVLGEYGLIVCGWSARYDRALRNAIYRINQRWYMNYWVEPFALSPEAQDVIKHLRAEMIQSQGDDFFVVLQRDVESLTNIRREHPLTVAVAVEQVKKLLPLETSWIELEDSAISQARMTYDALRATQCDRPSNINELLPLYRSCLDMTYSIAEATLNAMITLCWYGKGRCADIIASIMHMWSSPQAPNDEDNKLSLLAPLMLLYGCGIAAVRRSNWSYLRALILEPKIPTFRPRRNLAVLDVVWKDAILVLPQERFILGYDRDLASQLLRQTLRPAFQAYFRFDRDYEDSFDLFEMLLAVISQKYTKRWIRHDAVLEEYNESTKFEAIRDFWIAGARERASWGLVREIFSNNPIDLVNALNDYHSAAMEKQRQYPRYRIHHYAEDYRNELELRT